MRRKETRGGSGIGRSRQDQDRVTAAEAEAEKRPFARGWYCRATEGHCRWIGRLY